MRLVDLARDSPRRSAALLAVTLLAVAVLTSSSSSSSSKAPSSASASASPSHLAASSSSPPACAKKPSTTNNNNSNMGLLGAPAASDPEESRHAAQFAVEQLQSNAAFSKAPGALALARVVSAQRQVVAGTNHVLVLETRDASGAVKTVRATVWEKLPDASRNGARDMELTKFTVADGGAPAAEGVVECGAGGGGGGASPPGWRDAAARAAVDGINARSNSLVPYELSAVLEAKRVASPGEASELRLRLKRGDKSETFRVSVEEKEQGGGAVGATAAAAAGGGSFGLVSFANEP